MTDQEQTIERYLLGDLPELDRVTLEQQYFNDPVLFERIVEIENELNDKYVRGSLSPAMRERFEKFYLAHPARRERSAFAEGLTAKISARREIDVIPTHSLFDRLLLSLRGPKVAWAFSLAFVLVAVAAVWLLIQTRHLKNELARMDSERLAYQQRERELEQQVANERSQTAQLSKELQDLSTRTAPTDEPKNRSILATLVLTMSGTRAIDSGTPRVLKLSAETEQVNLKINLADSDYVSYKVQLQSAAGNAVYTSSRLTAAKSRSGSHLTLLIPARTFSTGDYMLSLRGTTKTGEEEDVSKSLFRVERK